MARFENKISLGSILTSATVLVAVAMAWANLDNRVTNNAEDIETVNFSLSSVTSKTRSVEVTQVRNSVQLSNILEIVKENKQAIKEFAAENKAAFRAIDARINQIERQR